MVRAEECVIAPLWWAEPAEASAASGFTRWLTNQPLGVACGLARALVRTLCPLCAVVSSRKGLEVAPREAVHHGRALVALCHSVCVRVCARVHARVHTHVCACKYALTSFPFTFSCHCLPVLVCERHRGKPVCRSGSVRTRERHVPPPTFLLILPEEIFH